MNLAGKISATVTITDKDGDTDSETVPIGAGIVIGDDGPFIFVATTGEAAITLITQDADTDGVPTSEDVATASFSGVFGLSSDFGADGAGTLTALSYALSLAVANGTNSGLDSNGAAIYLHNVSGVIVGSTESLPLNVNAGNTIFKIEVNSGSGLVTLTQYVEIDHTPGEENGPFDDQFAVLNTGLVNLTASATVTDSDGDTETGTAVVDLGGNIQFTDDGPSVNSAANALVQLDDENLAFGIPGGTGDNTNATPVAATGTLNGAFGADGPGSFQFGSVSSIVDYGITINLLASTLPTTLVLTQNGTDVLQIELNNTTGAYTVTQLAAIDHPAGLDENNIQLTIGYAVIDGDGDKVFGEFNIDIDDDTPTALSTANAVVQLDDDNVAGAGGNPGFGGDPTDGALSDDIAPAATSGILNHAFGADGGTVGLGGVRSRGRRCRGLDHRRRRPRPRNM